MPAPLFLIGFMAAGKTSVGRAIAAATGRRFVDLDDAVAALGEPPASLAARDLAEFRRREAAALGALIGETTGEAASASAGTVIATGGGAAAFGDNLARMRAAGFVVALGVDVAEARRRAAGDTAVRPLLAQAEQLAALRAPFYRRAHAVVDTAGRDIAQVAAHVRAVLAVWTDLPAAHRGAAILALGERSYPVTVADALDAELLRSAIGGATRLAVITDENVARHHLAPLSRLLPDAERAERAERACVVTLAPGEASKSFATYERVCAELVERGLDRGSAVVALGGGVVGDLAGFVAATLYRGVPVVQLPTTLVAMTDAAIGGKTAIDLPAGKNLVGAFWQPRLVACATETLATLPERERRAGFGELWKYALLDGAELWRAVAACAPWAAAPGELPPPPELRPVIDRSIAYKAEIVGRDERELTGSRLLLNLGHTVGHAIETASGMLHGEAVALGLLAACRVSAAVLGTPRELERELAAALAASGLSTDLDRWLGEDVLARVRVDKKRLGANLRFVAVREVGSCEPVEIAVTELRRILRPDLGA
ncbi:MAG TPA: 3-dehydroquinate synthase [Kofleriaceae bacterium]|nr:3-dehydroquinate synthase [Kofleriaceae bacterium]